MSILWTHIHRDICLVLFFVTRFRPFPANHRITLRTKKGGSSGRKTESRFFAIHYNTSCLSLTRQCIPESYIIVAHPKRYIHFLPLIIREIANQFISTIVYAGKFYARLSINGINLLLLMSDQLHSFDKTTQIRFQPQRGRFEHLLSVINKRVGCLAFFRTRNRDLQLTIRSVNNHILCSQRRNNCRQHKSETF